jgi:Fe-S cluster biogenesis protein NfuA
MEQINFAELVGKTLVLAHIQPIMLSNGGGIERVTRDKSASAGIHFIDSQGVNYVLAHEQECCESVSLEDVCGDLGDLEGSPILVAEHRHGKAPVGGADGPHYDYNVAEYNFYELATIKGSVTFRFHGASNGCYSMRADLFRIETEED